MTFDEFAEKQRINGGPHGFECVGRERMSQVWDAAQEGWKEKERVYLDKLNELVHRLESKP